MEENQKTNHPWQARISVAIIMLLLAFLGMVFTNIQATSGWEYWKWIVPIYALLALWLSWYSKRKTQALTPYTIYHELLHWTGVIGSIFLVSLFVYMGVISRSAASLFDLVLLALGLFLAGVYLDKTFLIIGIVLGLLALSTAFITQYLYILIIPLLFLAGLIITLTIWMSHRRYRPPMNLPQKDQNDSEPSL